MTLLRSLGVLAVLLGACASPRTPSEVTPEPDAGELTCDERARVRDVCLRAMTDRCASQQNDCEVACERQGDLPANTRKHPTQQGDIEASHCRENCRVSRDGCLRSLQVQCPVPCE